MPQYIGQSLTTESREWEQFPRVNRNTGYRQKERHAVKKKRFPVRPLLFAKGPLGGRFETELLGLETPFW